MEAPNQTDGRDSLLNDNGQTTEVQHDDEATQPLDITFAYDVTAIPAVDELLSRMLSASSRRPEITRRIQARRPYDRTETDRRIRRITTRLHALINDTRAGPDQGHDVRVEATGIGAVQARSDLVGRFFMLGFNVSNDAESSS